MSIAVNFRICFSCSPLFLINCFSLDYLFDLSIPALFPRSPFKGTDESRSLNFGQWDRTRYNCRTPFILPSQKLNLMNFLAATSLLEPPHLSRGAASELSWKDWQLGTHIFYHILLFFLWTKQILSFSAETKPFLSPFLSCIFTLCQWDSKPKLSVSLRQNNLFSQCT